MKKNNLFFSLPPVLFSIGRTEKEIAEKEKKGKKPRIRKEGRDEREKRLSTRSIGSDTERKLIPSVCECVSKRGTKDIDIHQPNYHHHHPCSIWYSVPSFLFFILFSSSTSHLFLRTPYSYHENDTRSNGKKRGQGRNHDSSKRGPERRVDLGKNVASFFLSR